jgi:radical SAM protein with 4Fe4S-binding SPASM domain
MQATHGQPHRRLPLVTAAPGTPPAPLEPGRAADGQYRPRFAVWELTLACTSRCRHCGSRAGEARPGELDTAEALRLADQLADLGALEVSLIGGEAYLHEGFFEVVERLASRGMKVAMATGGVGVDRQLAERAARAGLSSVSVSIDGIGKTHDALRGVRHGYEQARGALEHFAAAGVQIGINSQLNRKNLTEIEALCELVIESGARGWQVALTVAMGEAADRPELLLQPYELLELMPRLAAAKERLAAHDVIFWPGNNIGYFGPHEATLRGSSVKGHYSGCGAGRSVIGIESNGSVKGCPSLPTNPYSGGSVRDHSLEDIWRRAPALRVKRDHSDAELWGFCGSCYYKSTCRAGCTWTTHTLFGRAGNNPYCHHRALTLAGQGLRERLVPRDRAPGTPFDHGTFDLVLESIPKAQ